MSESQEGPTVEDFQNFFAKENLKVPMLATYFEKHLTERGEWHWATQSSPQPQDDYMLSSTFEYLKGPVPDQYSVCHAGHGMNSYALSFRHVSGELAMIVQSPWGGVYGDLEAQTARWNELVMRSNALLTITTSPSDDERMRKYLLVSSFRLETPVEFWKRSEEGWEIVPTVTGWDEAYEYLSATVQPE
jgi:hypothetical protein